MTVPTDRTPEYEREARELACLAIAIWYGIQREDVDVDAPVIKALADRLAQRDQEHARLERELREHLWLSHGHRMIYGDDGEMQCVECSKFGCSDYLRGPLDKVRSAYQAAILERANKPSAFTLLDGLLEKAKDLLEEMGSVPYSRSRTRMRRAALRSQIEKVEKERTP